MLLALGPAGLCNRTVPDESEYAAICHLSGRVRHKDEQPRQQQTPEALEHLQNPKTYIRVNIEITRLVSMAVRLHYDDGNVGVGSRY